MSNKIITNTISAVLALGLAGVSSYALAEMESIPESPPGMEKCYGISKAGRNDCGTHSYKCAGESKVDGDREAWINVPTGLCNRIIGGTTKPPSSK